MMVDKEKRASHHNPCPRMQKGTEDEETAGYKSDLRRSGRIGARGRAPAPCDRYCAREPTRAAKLRRAPRFRRRFALVFGVCDLNYFSSRYFFDCSLSLSLSSHLVFLWGISREGALCPSSRGA